MPMRLAVHTLESEPDTTLSLPADPLEAVLELFDTAARDPSLARDMVRLDEPFRSAVVQRRALELVEVYETARRRGLEPGPERERYERREGAEVFRDFLVLAVCKKATFAASHDPAVRGEALAETFRIDEAIDPVLDRIDRALFRVRFTRGTGTRILGDEEWDAAGSE
jgi:hypothetical protein